MNDLSISSKKLLSPPQNPKEELTRDWFSILKTDPVIEHIENDLWDQDL